MSNPIYLHKLKRRAQRYKDGSPGSNELFNKYRYKLISAMFDTLEDPQKRDFTKRFGQIDDVTEYTAGLEYCERCIIINKFSPGLWKDIKYYEEEMKEYDKRVYDHNKAQP